MDDYDEILPGNCDVPFEYDETPSYSSEYSSAENDDEDDTINNVSLFGMIDSDGFGFV